MPHPSPSHPRPMLLLLSAMVSPLTESGGSEAGTAGAKIQDIRSKIQTSVLLMLVLSMLLLRLSFHFPNNPGS